MKTIPTAEEFFEQGGTYPELAIEFAKLHVKTALEAASEKSLITIQDNYSDNETTVRETTVRFNSRGVNEVYADECTRHSVFVNEQSILNAYPDENIK